MVSCPLALHSHNYAAIILLMSRVCFTRYEAELNLIRSLDKVVATFELLCVAIVKVFHLLLYLER